MQYGVGCIVALFFLTLPLFAEELPRLAIMEITADGDFPSPELRTQLTAELRQHIADGRRYRVLDGVPQKKVLDALPDNALFADRRACLDGGCLPILRDAFAADFVAWTTINCGETKCLLSATVTPTSGDAPTIVLTEMVRSERGLRNSLATVAAKLNGTAPRRAAGTESEELPAQPNRTTLPDPERTPGMRTSPEQKLIRQNYIFVLQGFTGATTGARLTLGTLRWEHFQMEILSGAGGCSIHRGDLDGIYFSTYVAGLGGKWAVTSSGAHDLGFMIGLGGGLTIGYHVARLELLPAKLTYRYNMESGGVFEAGIAFPLIWVFDHTPNIQIFLGIGY